MLRSQLGDEAFFRAIKHYLEANRLQNVVTADLVKAIEESNRHKFDPIFDQWIYGAGAPRFTVKSDYDAAAKKKVTSTSSRRQKVEGHVGLFRVPVGRPITMPAARKVFPVQSVKGR